MGDQSHSLRAMTTPAGEGGWYFDWECKLWAVFFACFSVLPQWPLRFLFLWQKLSTVCRRRCFVCAPHSRVAGTMAQELTDEEKSLVQGKLHTLGRSILTGNVAFIAADFKSLGLENVDVLAKLPHLQDIDISDNKITTLQPLSGNNVIKVIRVGGNNLTDLNSFEEGEESLVGTRTLVELHASNNQIPAMPSSFSCTCLTHLDLAGNQISKITGLSQLSFLSHLDLSNNQISSTKGLSCLAGSLSTLSLANNKISRIGSEFMTFGVLRHLDLEGNRISDLYNLSHCSFLRELNVADNFICGMRQMEYLVKLTALETLTLLGNAIVRKTDYFPRVVFRLENLQVLDGEEISPEDRVKAANVYGGVELQHRQEVHERHTPHIPFENPFRVWQQQRDPPQLLVYATKAAGAAGQRFTFELWDEGEEYTIQGDPRTGGVEVHSMESMVLKAYEAEHQENLEPVAIDVPFDDAELFLRFVTIATQASAKADEGADSKAATTSEEEELLQAQAKAATLIQTLARQRQARERAEAAAAEAAAAEAATELLAEASAAANSESAEVSGTAEIAAAEEAVDTASATNGAASEEAAVASDDTGPASSEETATGVEEQQDQAAAPADTQDDATAAAEGAGTAEPASTDVAESKIGDKGDGATDSQNSVDEQSQFSAAVAEASKAVLAEQKAFEAIPDLVVDFPDSSSEEAVAAANAGSNNTDVIIHWNQNARFSARFSADGVVIEPGTEPTQLEARLTYGGSKKGFAVELFVPPTKDYQWPQRVRAARISEDALAARFPSVAQHFGNVLERRHAYAAQLGESGCISIEDGRTVNGVVLKQLAVRL